MARSSRRRASRFGEWPAYLPVAAKKEKAAATVAALARKGKSVAPVQIQGRLIATTFWGKGWCENLERYSDFESRLPRGRTYVRNGSVVDLQISTGKVSALVQGSSLYEISIDVTPVSAARWKAVVAECTGKIDSVVELLSGKLSDAVMEILTRKETGLFPAPAEIAMSCSCPDWATMCKHVAAVLYGVGARLDQRPELLFELRGARPEEMVAAVATGGILKGGAARGKQKTFTGGALSSLFGIDIEEEEQGAAQAAPAGRAVAAPAAVPVAVAKKTRARKVSAPAVSAAPAPAPVAKKTTRVRKVNSPGGS